MNIDYHYFKHIDAERDIASLPWVRAQKRRKAGLISSIDYATVPVCDSRSSYQLKSIARAGRPPMETEAWEAFELHKHDLSVAYVSTLL